MTSIIRIVFRDFLLFNRHFSNKNKIRVAIYGAGSAGRQLAAYLQFDNKYKLINFFDDADYLAGKELRGVKILKPELISKVRNSIDQILIAMPSLKRERRLEILDLLNQYNIPLFKIPSLDDIISGKASVDKLLPIEIEDLLYRKKISSPVINSDLFRDSVVCITGAGGSIGSELSIQILKLEPKKLILFEQNELALYTIYNELLLLKNEKTLIKPLLGNTCDFELVRKVFKEENVSFVYHAAAYKHVPLVESNPIAGIENNVFSTLSICEAAYVEGVKNLILISTDKAVRPLNVMGASKRVAELIVQFYSKKIRLSEKKKSLSFSMVRFGNVLNSSGSVVPLFKKQISSGGPITITHTDVIRYFMTISEAVGLVINASSFASGGEVFLLDMGKPVKIKDLALKMINLSGLSLKDESNPNGDIEIIYSGLRPGEKLFEELLIDGKSSKTKHPQIYFAVENNLLFEDLMDILNSLKIAVSEQNKELVLSLLKKLVPEWKSNCN